jgi:glycerol-3-phosphate dehydrogenase
MVLYDLLSVGKSVPRHEMLSRAQVLERIPTLSREGLLNGAFYYDAQVTFPERLVIENLVDACRNGAELATHARVTEVLVEQGRAQGVRFERAGAGVEEAYAAAVVNATGPWVDRVVAGLGSGRLIGGTKGSHIIVPPFPGAPNAAVYAEAKSDGRPFFVLPWNGLYLIGTTDERFEGDPGSAEIGAEERDYLVAETERLFPSSVGLAARVRYTHAGIRPLPHVPRGKTSAITRRHIVHGHAAVSNLWSVIGGKLTTHRALAVDVIGALRSCFSGLPRTSPTLERPLPGALAETDRDALIEELTARVGAAQAHRLWHVYGGRAQSIAAPGAQPSASLQPVVPGSAVLVAELVHALEHEWAATLEDLLQRRCMAGLAPDFGLGIAAAAAEQLVRLGVWDRGAAEEQLAAYLAFARRHGAVER